MIGASDTTSARNGKIPEDGDTSESDEEYRGVHGARDGLKLVAAGFRIRFRDGIGH